MKKNCLYFLILSIFSSLLLAQPNKETTFLPKAGTLHFEANFDTPYYIKNSPSSDIFLYVSTLSGKAPDDASNTPLNISLVLDRSGSMSGAKLHYAKEAAKFVIDKLDKNDNISLIAYDHTVQIVAASGKVKNKKKLKKRVDLILDNGATNLSGGMLMGFHQVQSTYTEGYVNRVLLLSDGLANRGITDAFKLRDTAQIINKASNITLSTFGLGSEFDENLLESLAEYGGANYYFIHEAGNIPTVFMQELQGLQSVIAQKAMVMVVFPSKNLDVINVYGYPYSQSGDTLLIGFNDVFATEEKAALIQFKLKPNVNTDITIETQLNYQQIYNDRKHQQYNKTLTLVATNNPKIRSNNLSTKVLRNIALFEANASLSQSIKSVDMGNYGAAKKLALQDSSFLSQQVSLYPTDTLLLKQYETTIAYLYQINNIEAYNEYRKKMMQKYAKSNNYMLRKKKPEQLSIEN